MTLLRTDRLLNEAMFNPCLAGFARWDQRFWGLIRPFGKESQQISNLNVRMPDYVAGVNARPV